jgi:hypothetical protein
MEAVCFSETLASTCKRSWRHNPEHRLLINDTDDITEEVSQTFITTKHYSVKICGKEK